MTTLDNNNEIEFIYQYVCICILYVLKLQNKNFLSVLIN